MICGVGRNIGGDIGGDIGGEIPPPPPPSPESEVTPESKVNDNMNILIENSNLLNENQFIDLSKAKINLGDIESELKRILKD